MSLAWAVKTASESDLPGFARSILSDTDSFLADPRAPNSAATIALVFIPESIDDPWLPVLIKRIFEKSTNLLPRAELPDEGLETEPTVDLPTRLGGSRDDSILAYLRARSEQLGWAVAGKGASNAADGDTSAAYCDWLRIRTTEVDLHTGRLDILTDPPLELVEWTQAVVGVVQTFRRLHPSELWFTLREFETRSGSENVKVLLDGSTAATIERHVEVLVVPYCTYLKSWAGLVEWVLSAPLELLVQISHVQAIQRALLAVVLASLHSDSDSLRVLSAIATSANAVSADTASGAIFGSDSDPAASPSAVEGDFDSIQSLIASSLTQTPKFVSDMAQCAILINPFAKMTVQQVAKLRLFGSQSDQQALLSRIIPQITDYATAQRTIQHLYTAGVMGKVDNDTLQSQVLSGALQAADFEFVAAKFPHPSEKLVLDAFDQFYDSATNGNKTRGKMKSAAACLDLVSSSSSDGVERRRSLLYATHELSNFSLNFAQGVPVTPLDIKNAHDPLEIISRVLELNASAYKDLDLLTEIANRLVHGTSSEPLYDHKDAHDAVDSIPVRIEAMCVQSALVDTNFTTAYQYASDLSTLRGSQVAWTACYQVGKFISPMWDTSRPPPAIVAQQADMLSRTLAICPKEHLATVLKTWRHNEGLVEASGYTPAPVAIEPSAPAAQAQRRKRDQISNLLVSGLGWAIGAKN